MQNIDGKVIFTEMEEIVEPSHTALVVWDVQNITVKFIFNKNQFLDNLNLVIQSARDSKIPIFYTAIKPLPLKYQSSATIYTYNKLFGRQLQLTEQDLNLAVKPAQDETVIYKHAASIFIGTDFERMIRNTNVDTVIFTGIATEFGIESSARDSLNRGFYTIVVSDAVSSLDQESHMRSLENMKKLINIVSSTEVINIWSKTKKH
jgi:nicotinamidase-related amidase